MKATILTFAAIASAAVLLLIPAAPGWAVEPEPEEAEATPKKKKSGLLGALDGTNDPSKGPRVGEPEDPPPDTETPGTGATRRAAPPLVHAMPDPKRLEARIQRLEGIVYKDVEPVESLDEARQRINRLRRRADVLRTLADRDTVEAVSKLAGRAEGVRNKWEKVIAAMNDGKNRNAREWSELVREAVALPSDPEPKTPDIAELAAVIADKAVGLPTPEELKAGIEATEEKPPGDEEEDPLEPVENPKPEADVAQPELADLIEAIENQAKPKGMPPFFWARLLDAFEQDRAELEVATAAARKRLKEQSGDEFAPVARALRDAQRTYTNLKKRGDKPGPAMRRHLAYRIHQAELAQLRLAHKDLSALATERHGEQSDRMPMIEMHPLNPAETLEQLARLLQVDGMPGAPRVNQFDGLTAEGLPDLYPPGSDMDKKKHLGNLVEASIARYQRLLRAIHRRMANMDDIVAQEDRAALRRLWSDMLHKDRLAERADHPINRAKRRVAVKEKYRDLRASRADRVEKRRAELQKGADATVKRLEAEYKRRDAMLEPEGDTPD